MAIIDPNDLKISAWPPDTTCIRVGMSKGVQITHIPTGMIVICDHERSQHLNRERALAGIQAMVDKVTPD